MRGHGNVPLSCLRLNCNILIEMEYREREYITLAT